MFVVTEGASNFSGRMCGHNHRTEDRAINCAMGLARKRRKKPFTVHQIRPSERDTRGNRTVTGDVCVIFEAA